MQELSQPTPPLPFSLFLDEKCSLCLKLRILAFYAKQINELSRNSSCTWTHRREHQEWQLIPANSPCLQAPPCEDVSPSTRQLLPTATRSCPLGVLCTVIHSASESPVKGVQQMRFAPVPEKTHLFSGAMHSRGWMTFLQRMSRQELPVYLLRLLA